MTFDDIKEYNKNAIEILRKHDQFATVKAVEEAFTALMLLGQFKWERDVAISQLEELGLSLGQNTEEYVCITKKEYEELIGFKDMYNDLFKETRD